MQGVRSSNLLSSTQVEPNRLPVGLLLIVNFSKLTALVAPDRQVFLADSLYSLASRISSDSLRFKSRSGVSIWLDTVTSGQASLLFFESLLLIVLGVAFGYLLLQRRQRVKHTDRIQGQALQFAAFALFALASKGLFFIIASFSLAGVFYVGNYGQLYWMGWQISLLWFVFFGFLFALSFVRSRQSYDIFFFAGLCLLFIIVSGLYNEWFWKSLLYEFRFVDIDSRKFNTIIVKLAPPFPFGTEHLIPQLSFAALLAISAHFALWVGLYGYAAFRIFRRSRSYQDIKARRASEFLAAVFFVLALVGAGAFVLFRENFSALVAQSFLLALICALMFYLGVRNVYKHGRYKRI